MKSALITPVLKKTSLDSNELVNYRPISNLSFVSKLLERHIAADLRYYIDEHTLLDPFQSEYFVGLLVRQNVGDQNRRCSLSTPMALKRCAPGIRSWSSSLHHILHANQFNIRQAQGQIPHAC